MYQRYYHISAYYVWQYLQSAEMARVCHKSIYITREIAIAGSWGYSWCGSFAQNAVNGRYLPREREMSPIFSCASYSFIFAHLPELSLTGYKWSVVGPCYAPCPAVCNSFLSLLELQILRCCLCQRRPVAILQQTSHLPIPGGLQKSEIYIRLATARKQAGNHSQQNWGKPAGLEKPVQRQ